MRKYYLDNIRSLIILLLIPAHGIMFFGQAHGEPIPIYTPITTILSESTWFFLGPWLMPVMFVIAGMTANYSLRRRTWKQFIIERQNKLLLPFFSGLLLIVPLEFYVSARSFGKADSFPAFIIDHFSHNIFLQIGHLWFIIFLYLISLACLPLFLLSRKHNWQIPKEKITLPFLIALAIPLALLGNFGIFTVTVSISGIFLFLLIGYFVFTQEGVIDQLKSKCWWLCAVFLALSALNISLLLRGYNTSIGLNEISVRAPQYWIGSIVGWSGVLAVFGLSARYLEFHTRFSQYLATTSFPVYIFHYLMIEIATCLVLPLSDNWILLLFLISIISYAMVFATYEIVHRIPGLRFIFGIAPPKKADK